MPPICMDQPAGVSLPSSQPASVRREGWWHLKSKYSPFTFVYAFCNACRTESHMFSCLCQTQLAMGRDKTGQNLQRARAISEATVVSGGCAVSQKTALIGGKFCPITN